MQKRIIIGLVLFGIVYTFLFITTAINSKRQLHYNPAPTIDLVSNPICVPACWQSLKPGQTSENDVASFYDTSHITLFTKTPYEGGYVLYSARYKDNIGLYALTQHGILHNLELVGPSNLTLSSVISNLGTPTHVALGYDEAPDKNLFAAIRLYYPGKGYYFTAMDLTAYREPNNVVAICLKETDRISKVSIFEPKSIEDIIREQLLPFVKPSEVNVTSRINSLSSWTGFSCIKLNAKSLEDIISGGFGAGDKTR
jgi:hypothetical protein